MWNQDDAYERYMGRWSRALADELVATVLDHGAALLRWLDVGCGTGSVIAAALEAGVARVDAVDPSTAFVHAVRSRFDQSIVAARVGDGEDLGGFLGPYDVAVSSLALNFAPDPIAVLRAMSGVLSHDDVAWAAVWEYDDERSFLARFWAAAERATGAAAPQDERTAFEVCTADGLAEVAAAAGWVGPVTELEVSTTFADPDDLWEPFLLGVGPAGLWLGEQPASVRDAVREELVADVFASGDGAVTLPFRARAVASHA